MGFGTNTFYVRSFVSGEQKNIEFFKMDPDGTIVDHRYVTFSKNGYGRPMVSYTDYVESKKP